MIKMHAARSRLVLLWMCCSGPLIALVGIQATLGKYGDTLSDMSIGYDWIVTMIVPTLSVMIAAMTVNVKEEELERDINNPILYKAAFCFSIVYFLCLYSAILSEPLTETSIQSIFNMTTKALGPIQGLVAGLISKFFIENF